MVERDRFEKRFGPGWLTAYRYVREGNASLDAARDLPKLALRPVGPDVTLPDGKALLAGGKRVAGETGPDEGRTAPLTQVLPTVDGGVVGDAGNRTEVVVKTQLQMAI